MSEITLMFDAIVITGRDNVATCLRDVKKGEQLHMKNDFGPAELEAGQDIPKGHKIALRDIAAGEKIIKYGEPIAEATGPIARGEHVHVHNVRD